MKKEIGKTRLFAKLLAIATLVTSINMPAVFAEGETTIPENSLVMQIGYNGTSIVDKTGYANSVTKKKITVVDGDVVGGIMENDNYTPYMHMTGSGGASIEVDSDAIKNLDDMTIDVWFLNDKRTDPGAAPNWFGRYDNCLFSFSRKGISSGYQSSFYLGLNDGAGYQSRGYGYYGELIKFNDDNTYNSFLSKPQHLTTDSSYYDEWVHMVITKKVHASKGWSNLYIYTNGVKTGEGVAAIEAITDEEGVVTYKDPLSFIGDVLRIGNKNPDDPTYRPYGFAGKIGDFKIYNYAKTADEISADYNEQKADYIENRKGTFELDYVAASKQLVAEAAEPNPYANGGVIKAAFTAPVHPDSVNEDTINLVDSEGNVIPGSVSVELSDQGSVAYISYGQVEENAEYSLKIDGLKSVNGVDLTTTSDVLTFTGGTLSEGILLVKPFDGDTIEFTLNYPYENLADLSPEMFEGTTIDMSGATYNPLTRTVTIECASPLVEGNEYTIGFNGYTKTFIAKAKSELDVIVPVIPEPQEPTVPAAPVEPEGSLMLNFGFNGNGAIQDSVGGENTTINTVYAKNVGGRLNVGTLANANHTPYLEMTDAGAVSFEIDSENIKNLGNMTIDVWFLNDQRTGAGPAPYYSRMKDGLFAFANPESETNKLPYYMTLNDGTTYSNWGYGFYGEVYGWDNNSAKYAILSKPANGTTNSSYYDEWVHMVITKVVHSTRNWANLYTYINGELVNNSVYSFTKVTDDGGDVTWVDPLNDENMILRVGHTDPAGLPSYGFTGKIGAFKIFNYAKSADDILTQYNAQKGNYVEDLKSTFALDYVAASKEVMAEAAEPNPYANGGVIKAAFTAAINEDTIKETTLMLVDADGNAIPGGINVELSDQKNIAYISYPQVEEGSEWYLKVDGLQSENGVPLTVTSDALTFTGGEEITKGINVVRPYTGKTIEVTLNHDIDTFDSSKLSLTAGGSDITITESSYDAATRTITLTQKSNFVQRGQYTVTYDGMSKTFVAEKYVTPITIGTPTFNDGNGNNITDTSAVTGVTKICSELEVVTDGTKEFVAILAVYCDGALVGTDMIGTNHSGSVVKFTNEVTELDNAKTYTVELTLDELDSTEEYTAKVMLWNGMGSMAPYTVPSGN